MEKVNEIKVPIPAGCKATTEIINGVLTVLIEKEKVKKEWKLEKGINYYYIDNFSHIDITRKSDEREDNIDNAEYKHAFRHESDAKAMLAYIQLLEMYYQEVGDYKPDWSDKSTQKHCLTSVANKCVVCDEFYHNIRTFAFETKESGYKFLSDYSELIEQAKRFL